MNSVQKYMGLPAMIITSFILLCGCNAPKNLHSRWLDKDVLIDARDNEWKDSWLYADQLTGTNIGIYNDDAYLYICFSTMDQDLQKMMVKQGFIVWFDETGGGKKSLGVRYPIGASSGGGSGGNAFSVKELQILTSENDPGNTLTVRAAAALDIYARVAIDESGKLIYELKMPLKKNDRATYTVSPSPGNKIGMGIMTVKATGRTVSGISGFGGNTQEIGGNTGAPGDNMVDNDLGNIMGNRNPDNYDAGKVTIKRTAAGTAKGKSLEFWAEVTLASKP